MHVFFSGIGGSGMSSLALLAKQAGYDVSGSDMAESSYTEYLRKHGITDIYIGQSKEKIADVHSKRPIDWLIYSPAIPMTNPNHPELAFARDNRIKSSREDDFLSHIITSHNLKLIAIAGTHGKSTTTSMAVWLFKQFNAPVSYSLGAKVSFADTAALDLKSEYFVIEADEFDRKFLSFYPEVALISGLDWDHPDIYPTREGYYAAFKEFIEQSTITFLWHDDAEKLALTASDNLKILDEKDSQIDVDIKLPGHVNRLDAWLVIQGLQPILDKPAKELIAKMNEFPGVLRRFEKLAEGLYTDYAHTPPKVRGALQLAHETAGDNVVVVYEGLHNTRQHFIKDELANLFEGVKQLYIVPSYLAREDPSLELLTPEKLVDFLNGSTKSKAKAAQLDDKLKESIQRHLSAGDLVLCFSAGGAGSLDEWLREEFK
ncbi:MAG TPA: Mur ligase domain-containing protein [Candidatus Saccharimonadales bacterium]|nr:Mur ligase domain-containing protein [Candidatus Saccharimonadales bacterium]